MKFLFAVIGVLLLSAASAQQQACPVNSNFSLKDLTHWAAYTGTFVNQSRTGGPKQLYDSTMGAPLGTLGVSSISEYQLPSVTGIRVITLPGIDQFGGFATIPNVNGYQYTSSLLLGSTQISRGAAGGGPGGYIRGISYQINVPSSPSTQPYTMTYAYAMVLENGQHNTTNQPWFTATLSTHDSVITCASPQYVLPTYNDAAGNGGGATLDTAAAKASGFALSREPSPNPNPNGQNGGHLQDVWWKGWTEVTFDLSPYRGQQVVLTFEADNCVPGGHFAYAYIALRKTCDGLLISGDTVACTGSTLIYSIPALGGARYAWSVPGDWSVISGSDSNILKVIPGVQGGAVIAHEINSCANLQDELDVTTTPPTIPGTLSGNAEVCSQNNSSVITLSGNLGSVLNWLASTDGGSSWSTVPDTTGQYVAQNLTRTTMYEAVVRHGSSCAVDSSTAVKITVDPKSVGGTLSPPDQQVCTGQTKGATLSLNGNVGSVVNWLTSPDGTNWSGFTPADTDSTYNIVGLVATTDYRVLVKSGVCPVDSSSISVAHLLPALFPEATAEPADTTICYGTPATLNATILIGTNYAWSNASTLTNQGNGIISATPLTIRATARPLRFTNYVLTITNAGCPNPLIDTFAVHVFPRVIVSAGNDTAIVMNQPLQLQATANDPRDVFVWSPALGLSNPDIANPVALLDAETDSI
ncbi:MAG: hypothetical protein Q8932_17550, partial [Bacteroidota bacterium]|nr:hypothetical protein [Bacteroidota bacterium]